MTYIVKFEDDRSKHAIKVENLVFAEKHELRHDVADAGGGVAGGKSKRRSMTHEKRRKGVTAKKEVVEDYSEIDSADKAETKEQLKHRLDLIKMKLVEALKACKVAHKYMKLRVKHYKDIGNYHSDATASIQDLHKMGIFSGTRFEDRHAHRINNTKQGHSAPEILQHFFSAIKAHARYLTDDKHETGDDAEHHNLEKQHALMAELALEDYDNFHISTTMPKTVQLELCHHNVIHSIKGG